MSPVIGLDLGLTTNPHAYNYAYIAAFGRYYYVSNWEYSGRLWWASLAVDVLATYKPDILSNYDYVARAGTGYDGRIIDLMYPAKIDRRGAVNTVSPSNLWADEYGDGCYVVGIINNDDQSIGAVSYYLMLPGQFADLKAALLTDTDWTGITVTNPDLGDELYRSIFNPYQYIVSVNWFPFVPNYANIPLATTINVGWWTLNVSAYRLRSGDYIYRPMDTINNRHPWAIVYNHPQSESRGEFLNGDPYTTYRLFIPPFGEFQLDGSVIAGAVWESTGANIWPEKRCTIYLDIRVDLISGQGALRAYVMQAPPTGSGIAAQVTLLQTQTAICVPIQLAQMATPLEGQAYNVLTGWLSKGAEWYAKATGAVDITDATKQIGDGIAGAVPHLSTVGNNGSITQYAALRCLMQTEYAILVDDAILDKGRPVCKYDLLSNYTNYYVQTSGAHVEIAGYDAEISMINSLLDSGVYLE